MADFKFYYGVMGAGKTTELVKAYKIYQYKNLNPLVIKPVIDNREGFQNGWGTTSSRLIKESIPAYYFKNLRKELWKLNYQSIFVDEAQFLTKDDIKVLSDVVDLQNINVLAYGLKTDSNGHLFDGAAELLVKADVIQELPTFCDIPNCEHKATMHLRYIDNKLDLNTKSVVIETGNVTYKSVCRKHWYSIISNKQY